MKALVKTGKGVGFSCMDVAVPVPGPGEVLVKVHATGVCGSDIHKDWKQVTSIPALKESVRDISTLR